MGVSGLDLWGFGFRIYGGLGFRVSGIHRALGSAVRRKILHSGSPSHCVYPGMG